MDHDQPFILQDLKLSPSIAELFQSNDLRKITKISIPNSNDFLIIIANILYWYKGDILSRKLKYDSNIINAFFINFIKTGLNKESLVVLLKDSANVYYIDGKSYTISFPFKIINGLEYPNGVILQREIEFTNINNINSDNNNSDITDNNNNNNYNVSFLTMLEPMSDFGTVISSTTSNISPFEKLIYFPKDKNSTIAITINDNNNEICFYNIKFLNRSGQLQNHHQQSQQQQQQQQDIRRNPSVSRKLSTVNNNKEIDDNIVEDETSIKLDKKRLVSHSDALSIDRMASYDFNNSNSLKSSETFSTSNPNSATFDSINLRKDSILTKIMTISSEEIKDLNQLKIQSLSFENKQTIIIQSSNFLKFFIWENDNRNSIKFIKSIDLSPNYSDFITLNDLPGFLLLISKNSNNLTVFNPFLSIELSIFKSSSSSSSSKIIKIYDYFNSNLIFQNNNTQEISKIKLNLTPKLNIVENCLNSFKYLSNSYSYHYIRIIWIYCFAIVKKDWDAFILTILSIILPISIDDSLIDNTNLISKLLQKIKPIQLKLIKDQFSLYQLAPNIVLTLHLIREDLKLNILNSRLINDFGLLLKQLTYWMNWNENWLNHYDESQKFKVNKLIKFSTPQLLNSPPNLLKSLNSLFENEIVPYLTFSQLSQESESIDEKITQRSYYVLRLFEAIISPDFNSEDVVNMMVEFNINSKELETYPIGVLIPLKESIMFCQENLQTINPNFDYNIYKLIDRKDLSKLVTDRREYIYQKNSNINHSNNIQIKDIHQIIHSINESEDPIAPLEHDRFQITKSIFNEDRRFYEISKILQTFQNQTVICNNLNTLSENDSLIKRKSLASLVALRTLTIPLGRSIMLYSSKIPLITEKFPIPKLVFTVQILPDNINVSYEKDSINSNCYQWGNFHNGVSAGLTISKDAKGISGSWIVFNKPANLNAQHGGFLLGLGLNGHLTNLEEWNIYNYLGPKHLYTSIGLLLGMSASLRGTMDVKLTKVLSVHVVALLPQGASDLIVSSQVQTAGLIGIGLLYLETQHRRMSEILLSQISGKISIDEKEVAEESYRLAAGISLGYVNLGKGDDLKGLNDTHVVDNLLSIAITMKDVQTEESFDKSMNGAILALSFIYLKTNNEIIAEKLKIPETDQLLDYFRPDVLLLRVLGKNLIMWNDIDNTQSWIESEIPSTLLKDYNYKDLNFHNVVAGLCLSMALKYASTGDLIARDSILYYYDRFTTILNNYSNSGSDSYNIKVLRNSLSQLQIVLALCLSLIMASTGDLEIFRRLRILHGEFKDQDETDNNLYGKFMAVNMALGFLFLAGGQFSFVTDSNFAIASLITSIYPIFPKIDNSIQPEVHLQALRHFWSMAVEPRCLIIRDVENLKPITTDVEIKFKDGTMKILQTPKLLPPLNLIKEIKLLNTDEYYNLSVNDLNLINENGFNIYVYKRNNLKIMKKSLELILNQLKLVDNDKINKIDNINNNGKFSTLTNLKVFDKFLQDDLNNLFSSINPLDSLNSDLIDKQIELNQMISTPKNIDDLWNLKLLFAFYDRILSNDDIYYLTLEFIDDLQNKLWIFARKLNI
ncbi:hypothetical protein WICMUC_001624 [Wickerhamomyces mucosus]|uniref:Anaphase-promoting complex subunit 1 N-terminal domain-containing protein n=1 Tax=Wickerhamomyces mucosus TaxID=1378264 RepID=A0A9P8PV72_9ASCO|nr:hypothetical protein WICMUC_001624 [Wickerhamomyces mucosus]